MNKSKLPISWFSRLIASKTPNLKPSSHHHHRHYHLPPHRPISLLRPISSISKFNPSFKIRHFSSHGLTPLREHRRIWEEFDKAEREEKRKAGIDVNAVEDEEDWMGVEPIIEKLEKENAKKYSILDKMRWDPTVDGLSDSDFEDSEDEDDPEVIESKRKERVMNEKKRARLQELVKGLSSSRTTEDSLKWMKKIDKFEEKHFRLKLEYKVIDELVNRFREATGKDKFLLAQKLNRAVKFVEWKKAFDPKDPTNYGIIHREEMQGSEGVHEEDDDDREKHHTVDDDEEEEEFDVMKERDDILLEKLSNIDKMLEEKLTVLDHTFGKKGKLLEEEIRVLAEERNSLTEKKRKPMYRKGFDLKLIDVNRTCKVTKGGQVIKFTAIVACGNYNGIIGYAKAKGPAIPVACQRAHEKCFQNLHYIDRYEDHTIAHAVQATYKKTKVYLWPGKTASGMKAGKHVQAILNLAGFKNVKSKVIGSRNPHNTVKAVFQALNAIETPKDVQEKFGRTVVESYLL